MVGPLSRQDHPELLQLMSEGGWHSGEELARILGLSRAAVWKRLQRLEELPGIEFERLRGKGYRLRRPLELLERGGILASLQDEAAVRIRQLHLLSTTESTNSYLRDQSLPALHYGTACLAEHQTGGRGRRGRRWVSTYGRNIYLSLAWRFDLALQDLAGLSLAAGVTLARVLERFGLRDHRLKWPNDLLVKDAKLAGILVEASGEATGPCTAVIGVGVNLELDAPFACDIDQPWTDLRAHLQSTPPRNRLAGELLNELVKSCMDYQREGLAPFLVEWKRWDGFLGEQVELVLGNRRLKGVYCGLDRHGGLRLECDGRVQSYHAGEVSLRRADEG